VSRILKKPFFLAAGALGFAAILLLAYVLPSLAHFERGGVDYGRRPILAGAVAFLMAVWWISEATSIYLTALVPLVLFPLLGIFGRGLAENVRRALLPYFDGYIFLFLGGMTIAAAMQTWNLHSRTALHILRKIGTRSPRVLLGMLLATASVSLWISNTATAAMMLPIGMALIAQIEKQTGGKRREFFGGALMLAIAYGANVGGMGTKIGTAPNLYFCGFVSREFHREISFLEFLGIGFPFVCIFLPVVWGALWLSGRKDAPREDIGRTVIQGQLKELGPMTGGERAVLVVFVAAAALWIWSAQIHALVAPTMEPLFASLGLGFQSKHVEAGVGMAAMLALLALPAPGSAPRRRVLRTRDLRAVPWETLILLGGGFCLAEGIEASGLSIRIGDGLGALRTSPALVQFLGVSLATVYFGAIASNVATTAVMLVVLKGASVPEVLSLMAAATLASSCDFMLPAGTPPNAIVFGSGYLTIPRMARTGFVLDLISAILVALWGMTGVRWILS
jgi:sodium-dependent dicarboxylate transporter 2/3/5